MRNVKTLLMLALAGFAWLGSADAARAQTAANVAVVINEAHEDSVRVGEHYVRQRGIPASQVIRIQTSVEERIDRAAYAATIEGPIAGALARGQLQDRILFLVLTRGIPLRIDGTTGQEGTGASVDSELTLLYRRMVGTPVPTRGRVDNPYFLRTRDIGEARPFTRRDHDIFLVSRLDAFTVEEAMALVDRAQSPRQEGRIVLDQRADPASRLGDDWLAAAAARLAAAGHGDRVLLETTAEPARAQAPVLGYYSWGSTDPGNRVREVGMAFAPGSIAAAFVSNDARTFAEPPETWRPAGDSTLQSTWFEGSSHSLVGDLIREGVTGVAGHVAEPYLHSVVRPDVLFEAYLAGFTLIESFYLAMPSLGWQTVVIGDPLCRPFAPATTDEGDVEPAMDADTELPEFFSARRRARVAGQFPNMPPPAVVSWVRAVGARARGDAAIEREALKQTVDLAPDVAAPRLELASLHDKDGEFDAAIAQYRRILEIPPWNVRGADPDLPPGLQLHAPDNWRPLVLVVALNNLAYSLAVHKNAPEEALPLAERALALAPKNAGVLDTFAWVEHLLGRHASAARHLAQAIRLDPAHATIRLHAAIVYAATGARTRAEAELNEALRLDPSLEESEQVRELRETLREQDIAHLVIS